jgi:hypothetical protein
MEIEAKEGGLDYCPYCGSHSIEGDMIDIETDSRPVECLDCRRRWYECYAVVTIDIPEEYKQAFLERQFIVKHCICGKKSHETEICPVHDEVLNIRR